MSDATQPHPPQAVLWQAIDAVLPQTQCTRCGEPDCASYAQAIAKDHRPINQCPPGGAEGISRLARVTGQTAAALNPQHGTEGPRMLAIIDEAWCIGCTLCIKACPVDCIVGAPKRMHTVVEADCTGCELCLPACPVDCIDLVCVTGERTGWDAWSEAQAHRAKARYAWRRWRLERDRQEHEQALERKAQAKLKDLEQLTHTRDAADLERKRVVVQAALERARKRRLPGSAT